MKLRTQPKLIVSQGQHPNLEGQENIAIFFKIEYSYDSSEAEAEFMDSMNLVILEDVSIMGYDPARPGDDIDLKIGIRPRLNVRPENKTSPKDLRDNNYSISRSRTLYVLKKDILNTLKGDGLNLNSVKAYIQLTYAHIGNSEAEDL